MIVLSLFDSQQKNLLQEWIFEQESLIRVGRAADNDVVLNDALVSRHHLELHHLGYANQRELWQLQSQGTNGTFLNGKLVSQRLLSENCLIQLGPGGPVLKLQTGPVSPTTRDPLSSCTHGENHPDNLFCIHCGQPILVQWTIRNYHVLCQQAEDGTDATYLTWQPQPLAGQPQLQVLKAINPQPTAAGFEQLARMYSLHHPRIPQIFDCFEEAGKLYVATELIHGQDLDRWIKQHGSVPPQQAIAWMLQLCEVLDYVHNQDPPIVHGDIQPRNLIVRHLDQQIAVVNFGFEQQVDTLPRTQIATGYRAPEQDQGLPCPQSDLYAIGATLLFLLTGENPHRFYQRGSGRFNLQKFSIPLELKTVIQRSTAAIQESQFPSGGNDQWHSSRKLRSLFQWGSHSQRAKNHSKAGDCRYQTATELAQALQTCM